MQSNTWKQIIVKKTPYVNLSITFTTFILCYRKNTPCAVRPLRVLLVKYFTYEIQSGTNTECKSLGVVLNNSYVEKCVANSLQ